MKSALLHPLAPWLLGIATVLTGWWCSTPLIKAGITDIQAFELASDVEQATTFLRLWHLDQTEQAHLLGHHLLLDSLAFVPAYSLLLASLCVRLAQRFQERIRWVQWLWLLALLAGGLDWVENYGMSRVVQMGGSLQSWITLMSSAATLKWGLVYGLAVSGVVEIALSAWTTLRRKSFAAQR